jgi:hypothetical protein
MNFVMLFFVAALIYSLYAMTAGWGSSIAGIHGFRQTQTAITAYYLKLGGPWFAYETPVLGAPWSIPFEFPLYQWMVAAVSGMLGTPLDQTGRAVSVACFYLTLLPMTLLLRDLGVSPWQRWLSAAMMLMTPLYLFWSRAFMIESLALLLSMTALAVAARCMRESPRATLLVLGAAFGMLAAMVKITTFFPFALGIGALAVWRWNSLAGEAGGTRARQAGAIIFCLVVLPLIAAIAWTRFADSIKALNPSAAGFITSEALQSWNFGTLQQRLSGAPFEIVFRMLRDLFGHAELAVLLLVILPFAGRFRKLMLAGVLIVVATLFTFTNLHVVHNYYQYAIGIFLVIAMALGLAHLIEREDRWRWAGLALLGLLLFFQTRIDWPSVNRTEDTALLAVADAAKRLTMPDEVLLIYGEDWSSVLPYYSERRALMDRVTGMDPDGAKSRSAFSAMADVKIGAMLFCRPARHAPDKMLRLLIHHRMSPEVAFSNEACQIHLPR